MKKIITSIIFLVLVNTIFAQTKVQYAYDANGNRIQRKLIVGPSSMRMTNTTTKDEEETKKTSLQEGISVYPNPVTDKVVLSIKDFNPSERNMMSLLDSKGNEMLSQKVTQNQSEMDVSKLTSGIYYFKVIKNQQMLYYKLVKVD